MAAIDYLKLLQDERRRLLNSKQKSLEIIEEKSHSIKEISGITTTSFSTPTCTSDLEILNMLIDSVDFDLENYKIDSIPSLYYIQSIIDEETENVLIDRIQSIGTWVKLSGRQLQQWGSLPPIYGSNQDPIPFPTYLQTLVDTLRNNLTIFQENMNPNNILINQYEANEGIIHHTDGPAYKNYVVILSLESDCIMTFKPNLKSSEIGIKSQSDVLSVYLERRSLLIFTDDLYTHFLHGIYENATPIIEEYAPCVNLHMVQKRGSEQVSLNAFFFNCFIRFTISPCHAYLRLERLDAHQSLYEKY
jgi:alkylated DNA repair protein alkB homolog 6